ncbi:hypothetical protein D3C71_1918940 [compost metagenome]
MDDASQAVVVLGQVIDQGQAVLFFLQVGLKLHDVGVCWPGADAAAGADHGVAGLCQADRQLQAYPLTGSGNKDWTIHSRVVGFRGSMH